MTAVAGPRDGGAPAGRAAASVPGGRLGELRRRVRDGLLGDEAAIAARLAEDAGLGPAERRAISADAAGLVRDIRASAPPTLMESFLDEYGLSTGEGVAFMCLAEALLRVPDVPTVRELIGDKLGDRDWRNHLGHSSSPMVNASTWALMLTGRVLTEEQRGGIARTLRRIVRRTGEPVIRTAVARAIRLLGGHFVLGRDMGEALARAVDGEAMGCTHSYDMLGEGAVTRADAQAHFRAYADSIRRIGPGDGGTHARPGISVKLSALHPRHEARQRDRALPELAGRVRELALLAKGAGIGLTVDAEEADRLDLSLDVLEALASDPALDGWDGLGAVVQAYGLRAAHVIDWIGELSRRHGRRLAVRLVKGAYWDTEIKRAQERGLDGFPVFTRKSRTDVSYLACARRLLDMRDRVRPQFATHNAHTAVAVLRMAGVRDGARADGSFEMQRLHGMGEALHQALAGRTGVRCRVYAPVGTHRDLLAYLVRRLLENGANSSFVHQLVDPSVPPESLAADPAGRPDFLAPCPVASPLSLHAGRRGARGWDLTDPPQLAEIDAAREAHRARQWRADPDGDGATPAGAAHGDIPVRNPADPADEVGRARHASAEDADRAVGRAGQGFRDWSSVPAGRRAETLERAADLYEGHAAELFALAAREAGKTLDDAVGEVREAVDFLRHYACEARRRPGREAAGVFACVSPWNFPLAIFTGQVAAALAAGNAVVAKPAEQTPLMAARATALLREAGVPPRALQLLPGDGPRTGERLVSDPRIAGVAFTGSTGTARRINRALAAGAAPHAPLVAETGGVNAAVVDSTALPEQAVRDIVTSAFRSAGQRCSALRVLCLQQDIAGPFLEMLAGAIDELVVGDPWLVSTDVGPVIDADARATIDAHCSRLEAQGRLVRRARAPEGPGLFVAPALFRVDDIREVGREVFGPVLHVATFGAGDLDGVIDAVNAGGHGLTFGLHTRIDGRVARVARRVRAGNIYVNRNQIGAVVGSQPFGGEGLSGTGPKAGGPRYLDAFCRVRRPGAKAGAAGRAIDPATLQRAIDGLDPGPWGERADRRAVLLERSGLPGDALAEPPGETECEGPVGESNRLTFRPRGTVLCLGPDPGSARLQALEALLAGNAAVVAIPGAEALADRLGGDPLPLAAVDGTPPPGTLAGLGGIGAVASFADEATLREQRKALAIRDGALVPLVCEPGRPDRYQVERHVCVDTTVSGGNATLLAAVGDP